jgi:hypothetical protein
MATEHGFKMEQKKDNKVDVEGKTPDNKNDRRGSSKKSSGGKMDPAMLQAIMMMLAQMEGSAPPGGPGGPGGMPPGGPPMGLPPGAVPMGPPPGQNPAMQGRMGMMPPMSGAMPPGGPPVR